MHHRKRFLANASIAALTGFGNPESARRAGPALLGTQSRFRRFEGEDKEPTLEELKQQLAAANADRDRYKGDFERVDTEHKTTAQKLKEREDADKSAEQKTAEARQSEIDSLKGETTAEREKREALEGKLAKRDAIDALRGANVIDPELAYGAIRDAIEIKDGEPTNIAKLVEKFVADRPAMVGKTPPDTRPSNPSTQGGGGNDTRPGRPAGRI